VAVALEDHDPELAPHERQPDLIPTESANDQELQPRLFRDVTGGPKVVPIPTLSPLRPPSPLDRDSVRRAAARSSARTVQQTQQSLDLQQGHGELRARPDETLYCDARVATPTHRAMAAAIDGLMMIAGSGIFLAVAFALGVDFGALGNWVILPAAMMAVVTVLYRGLWCLVNRDTPGMHFAGLRLVDFDGRTPRRDLRIVRQFAGLLSLFSAGVGLVWALVDDESLTWHDHISKTFPTTA
jgi:uncharacterized RDD family membrane protein YckC